MNKNLIEIYEDFCTTLLETFQNDIKNTNITCKFIGKQILDFKSTESESFWIWKKTWSIFKILAWKGGLGKRSWYSGPDQRAVCAFRQGGVCLFRQNQRSAAQTDTTCEAGGGKS